MVANHVVHRFKRASYLVHNRCYSSIIIRSRVQLLVLIMLSVCPCSFSCRCVVNFRAFLVGCHKHSANAAGLSIRGRQSRGTSFPRGLASGAQLLSEYHHSKPYTSAVDARSNHVLIADVCPAVVETNDTYASCNRKN